MTQRTDPHSEADDGSLPRDLDDFMRTLKRRLAALDPDGWMQCASPHCRRVRRCADDDMPCCTSTPAAPMTEEERAAMMADLQRALRARMQRR